MLATAATYLTGEPMKFTEAELLAIQFPRSEHYGISATYSASLTMGNCVKIHAAIDARRRVDGTVSAADVKAVYLAANVQLDEWALGPVNFAEIADDFNDGREPESIPDVIRDSLTTMTVVGTSAKLSAQLDRADYAKVNKILEALGGKWNKKAGAHVFAGCDPEEVIASYLETGKLDKPEKFGFFPTPAPLARELVKLAGLRPGHTVLEPEAGVGGIATVCADVVGKGSITCYEIQQKNCDVLRSLGFQVEQADFLNVEPTQQFSHVILNPPFEKQQDISHVLHAFRFLEPGGTMAAIMSIGVTFRTNSKTTQFRAFLDSMGATIKVNDKDAFKESGTAAQTVSIVFQKPHDWPTETPARIEVARPAPAPVLALEDDLEAVAPALAIVARIQPKTIPQPAQAAFAFF
jgi:predicted RNA methylase